MITSTAAAISVTNPITVAITAPVNNTNGTVTQVDFYSGTTLLGTATTAPYSISWNNPAIGKYSITAKATDSQGPTKTSSPVSINVNVAPTVTLTAPMANVSYSAPATITLTADASDLGGTVGKVQFYRGTTLLGTA